jgi:thiosulfate dehydrogenase [quinone] large subunit
MVVTQVTEPTIFRLFADTRTAWVWLLFRLYVGWVWLEAGWGKLWNPLWTGAESGTALTGFVNGALAKTSGAHPDVQGWYAFFLESVVLPHAQFFSLLIALGEVAVGVGLLLGVFTGIAAFFGSFMSLNFLLAGSVSVNPVMLILQLSLVLAWKVAGYYGGDRYLLPFFRTPWDPDSRLEKRP